MTAGNAQVTVTYTAPTSNGGSAITSYTVSAYTSLLLSSFVKSVSLSTATPSPITVTGLTNGTPYYFSIYASNIRGAGISYDISSTAVKPSPFTTAADILTDASFTNLISSKAPLYIFSPSVSTTLTSNNTQMKDVRSGYSSYATMSGVTVNSATNGGAAANITYLSGTTSSSITFPNGSKPSSCTICSVTKYSNVANATKQRILQDISNNSYNNWIHGHWGGSAGVMHNAGQSWRTSSSSTISNVNDWVVMCSRTNATATVNNVIVNNVSVGVNEALNNQGPYAITINGFNVEKSDFDFAYLYVWNQELTYDEMTTVSKKMLLYLRTGIM